MTATGSDWVACFRFQQALKNYGVADVDVFQTVDLWEKKDISQVTTTLFALGRTVRSAIVGSSDSWKWSILLDKKFLYEDFQTFSSNQTFKKKKK